MSKMSILPETYGYHNSVLSVWYLKRFALLGNGSFAVMLMLHLISAVLRCMKRIFYNAEYVLLKIVVRGVFKIMVGNH